MHSSVSYDGPAAAGSGEGVLSGRMAEMVIGEWVASSGGSQVSSGGSQVSSNGSSASFP